MAPPVPYGRRLIPQILDDLAATEPDRLVYSAAKSADISEGFLEVTARQFTQAVDKIAWWLREEIGERATIEPLGYIGPHDIRHVLLTHAAVKAGYTTLFLSPKNSTEGALAVLDAAKCNVWIQPGEQQMIHLVQDFLEKRPMKVLHLPETAELLDAESVASYPYSKTFEEAAQEPICILHTSGSTGLPKPSVWSHALLATMDAVRLLPPTKGDLGLTPWTQGWDEKNRIYSSFPMSHGAGVLMDIMIPALFGLHCILGPAGVIPNMGLIESLAEHGKIDIWSMVPSLVDELGETPDVLAKFSSSKFICASGGPTSPTSAGKVNNVIRVLNLTGTTEGLFIGNLWVEREDWRWFAFHPWSGFEFREVEPGVYEHWIRRNEHWELFQGIFHTFPDQDEYNFKDLYIRHPTNPDLWAYKGRSDDVVVLSNGYKIAPLDTEAFVSTHPAVNGCLVVGSGEIQAGLLIELKDHSARNNEEVIDSIWETVQKTNESSMHKNQFHRDYIMFADEDKPFIRTDKGTVKRRATLNLYQEYIKRFYDSQEEEDPDGKLSIDVDTESLESISNAISQIIRTLSPNFENVAPDADLFNLGMDSLLVFRVIRTVRQVVGLQEQLAPRHLYANPTIAKFSSVLLQLIAGAKTGESELDGKVAKMKELLEKYKSRQSAKMSPFDLIMPKLYVKLLFCLPLKPGASSEKAFEGLQRGLARLYELVPGLDAKVSYGPENDKKGQVQLIPAPVSSHSEKPRQLVYRDLSKTLPSFDELRNTDFVASAFQKDELLLEAPWFPPHPTDAMISQANFVEGGCLLATGFHHSCFDGSGVVTVIRAWAECCRFVQGDATATCDWIDSESMNRSLPQVLWEQEGFARPIEEIDPATWDFLGFSADEGATKPCESLKNNGALPEAPALPPPPVLPPPKPERSLESRIFSISGENMEKLKQEVAADPEAKGLVTSASDMVQALFWRASIRARYEVEKDKTGKVAGPDEVSILELPIDCRPFFSPLLPSSYMGNLIVVSRPNMPVETLCAPETSIGRIALVIREATGCVRQPLIHDAFTLLKTVPDYSKLNYAFMRQHGLDVMITNMMLFPTSEASFGGDFFAQDGKPSAVRLLMDGFNSAFRMCIILPLREDGGVDLVFATYPEELKKLLEDNELARYAAYVG
ncbi:transferase family [Paramyrothecium foliicola]|nr:transferase family [Paramyrothecium foliicola]